MSDPVECRQAVMATGVTGSAPSLAQPPPQPPPSCSWSQDAVCPVSRRHVTGFRFSLLIRPTALLQASAACVPPAKFSGCRAFAPTSVCLSVSTRLKGLSSAHAEPQFHPSPFLFYVLLPFICVRGNIVKRRKKKSRRWRFYTPPPPPHPPSVRN